jgi:hypothetical protein
MATINGSGEANPFGDMSRLVTTATSTSCVLFVTA